MRRQKQQAISALVFALLAVLSVQACGPDFAPDVFVRRDRPDDARAFGLGSLGILQTGYSSKDYAVAWRYLNGGKLSPGEQRVYAPPQPPAVDWRTMTQAQMNAQEQAEEKAYQESLPEAPWTEALVKYAPQSAAAKPYAQTPQPFYLNTVYYAPGYAICLRPAFATAAHTLARRARLWGQRSPWLMDWVAAQQAVFTNCDGKDKVLPPPAPAGSPALLKQDRAYQTAAAEFYAGEYAKAKQAFEAIGTDRNSPWHKWGKYLAARAQVRAAFAAGPKTNPWSEEWAGFDRPMMVQAQQMLEALQAHPVAGLPASAVRQELHLVEMRTEPDERMKQICAALAGPEPDAEFAQNLKDLSFALELHAPVKNPPPLYAWIEMLRQHKPGAAYAAWKRTPTLPWLLPALMQARPGDAGIPELLAAAAKVREGSPGWPTAMYERIRLLTGRGQTEQARQLLEGFLPGMRRGPASSELNAFLAERMAVARNFDAFLEYAPRTVLDEESSGASYQANNCPPLQGQPYSLMDCHPKHSVEFAADGAAVLNRMPLGMLVQAAQAARLPENLRKEVAAAAWTRSVVLGDGKHAAKLEQLVQKGLDVKTGDGAGFGAVLVILRHPGLRPYVEAGVSHLLHSQALDEYEDNWWCNDWQPVPGWRGGPAVQPAPIANAPAFLSSQETTAGLAEWQKVLALPCAPEYLGQRVLAYVRAHPEDPLAPEALALTVRATHYGCLSWRKDQQKAGDRNSAISKAAFELLHRRYPHSVWTKRTKYYY